MGTRTIHISLLDVNICQLRGGIKICMHFHMDERLLGHPRFAFGVQDRGHGLLAGEVLELDGLGVSVQEQMHWKRKGE